MEVVGKSLFGFGLFGSTPGEGKHACFGNELGDHDTNSKSGRDKLEADGKREKPSQDDAD
ncbi:hypothetical protein PMIN06_000514 [Paraphaeosphaeria minitans]